MAFTIKTLAESGGGKTVVADQRLWVNRAGDKLVEDGDPEAASLFCTPGKRVPKEVVDRLGGFPGGKKEVKEDTADVEDKADTVSEDKAEPKEKTAAPSRKKRGRGK